MNTQINLTHNGVKYVLEYDRMGVKMLEQNGFEINEFMAKPMSNIELVFAGAFIKNHRKTNQVTIDEIYKGCKNKEKLIGILQQMISETYESLLADPEENEGNVEWEIVDLSPTNK